MRPQYVVLHGHDQTCRSCGKTLREPIPFARGKSRHIKRFEEMVSELAKVCTIKHVAQMLGVGRGLVKPSLPIGVRHETRRELCRELEGPAVEVLKGSRFLLLKGGEKLDESGRGYLERLEDLNWPLYQAYLLKEDLRRFWTQETERDAAAWLTAWITRAKKSGLEHFHRLATTLDDHRQRLLSYFRHRIPTGPFEGLNNKIKVLKRQAYGFRDMEYLRLRLAFIHEHSVLLTGG
jgi:hypothetical protein